MAAALQLHPAAFESGQPDADSLQEVVSFNHQTGSRFPGMSGPKKSGRSAGDDCVETTAQLIESAQRDQRAVLGLAGVIAKRLDKLEILARTGACDLEEHASTLTPQTRIPNMARNLNNVPLHDFYENHPANPHGYVATTSKIGVFGGELSNSGVQHYARCEPGNVECDQSWRLCQSESVSTNGALRSRSVAIKGKAYQFRPGIGDQDQYWQSRSL